jgi:hypothetical protein
VLKVISHTADTSQFLQGDADIIAGDLLQGKTVKMPGCCTTTPATMTLS